MYLCQPYSRRTLVQGKLRNICLCPPHVDRQEWIASNRALLLLYSETCHRLMRASERARAVLDFWTQLNNFFSTAFAICQCPSMAVGPKSVSL